MKKLLCILFLTTVCFADIEIYKVLSVKNDPNYDNGSKLAEVVLSNGEELRSTLLGGLPNNNDQARAMILDRGQELFDKGKRWSEDSTNIECPQKTILDNFPTLENALQVIDNNFSSLTAQDRTILKKLIKVIFALKERGE